MSPLGTARTHGSSGEYINHCVGVRMRVVGSGELEMTLRSQDNVVSQALTAFTLSSTDRTNPFRLANFIQYRMQLEGKTGTINEIFRINRIVLYVKPFAVEEPA